MTTASDYSHGEETGGLARIHAYGRRVSVFVALVFECAAVARQRRQLLSLDDRALTDIGISRADATVEAMRGFWDVAKQMN